METMKPVHWIILVVALIAAICLLLFVRGHVTMKNLAAGTDGVKTDESTTSWWPSPADKYLPVWVIISMSLAVWVLATQVNSVVQEICQAPGRCETAASAASSSKAAKEAAAAASAAVAAASATAGASAAPVAPDQRGR